MKFLIIIKKLFSSINDSSHVKNWDVQLKPRKKEPDVEYAYILKSSTKPVLCSKQTLFDKLEKYDNIYLVATPQHDHYIIPGSDHETIVPILKQKKTDLKNQMKWGMFWISIFGSVFLYFSLNNYGSISEFGTLKLYFAIFGILPILSSLIALWEFKKMKDKDYDNEVLEQKFNFWIEHKPDYFVYGFAGIIVIIFTLQILTGLESSIDLAGLVKPDTQNGEYFRILTATLLHGSVMHIVFNAGALYVIGKMVNKLTGFYVFLSVFLVSGIMGSIFSLIFYPHVTSVGSSGGIMGFIGFLLVLGYKFKSNLPRSLIKSMLRTMVLIAVIGVLAYDIIDNAAHFGGALGGVITGLLLIKKQVTIPYKSSILIRVFGLVSGLILLFGVALIIIRIF